MAVAVLAWWAAAEAGYPLTTWAPGAIVILGLLGVALVVVPNRWGALPVTVRVAVAALAAFTAWSYLSILWADDPGAAWEGANRTLLYLALFSLFALWRHRGDTAALLVGAWTLALIALGVVTVLRLAAAGDPGALFAEDRLSVPAGYPNAAAAVWLMALWPAITLAAARKVPWWLRGLFAGGAVVLVDLALLAQSRGSLFAVPLVAVAFFALVPGRVRHFAAFALVAVAVAATVPTALGATDASGPVLSGLDAFALVVSLAGLVAGGLAAGLAWFETRLPPSPGLERRAHRAGAIAAAGAVVVALVAALVVAGNPVTRARDGWDSFRGGYAESSGGSRLLSGLGSNRYDFYRVGLDRFLAQPVAGIGADNFQQDYLAHGRSRETPRYPHSLELRTLAQTGLVGTLLLATALGAALLAALRGMRSGGSRTLAAGGGAMTAFLYWAVHGSADWFWEFAGLGGPAFALLGAACALAPRGGRATGAAAGVPAAWGLGRDRLLAAGVVAALTACALAIALPWQSRRDADSAARVFDTRPGVAFARLDRAADLDPLSDRPLLLEGTIALRLGDLERAEAAFITALDRNPRGAYAMLELGAIASARGSRGRAAVLLRRAAALAPRDPLPRQALAVVREGDTVDLANLARAILGRARDLTG